MELVKRHVDDIRVRREIGWEEGKEGRGSWCIEGMEAERKRGRECLKWGSFTFGTV